MTARLILTTLAALGALTGPLAAQGSIYSVLGLGFPGQPMGVRGRSLGGGTAVVEPRAALNPAAAAGFPRLTATVSGQTLVRDHSLDGTTSSGLQETRFPFGVVGGNVSGGPLSFALSYSMYADRTYDITTSDTLDLRGEAVPANDRLRSRGAITDVRGALAWTVSPQLFVGVGVHLLGGAARVNVTRSFANPRYATLQQSLNETFQGVGISAGAVLAPASTVRLGMSVRKDGPLDMDRDGASVQSFQLPTTVSGGIMVFPDPRVRLAATGIWRSWSEMQNDVGDDHAFDTWSAGTGLEVINLIGRLPLRVGARYETLPFSPTDEQPHDLTVAFGTGLQFASNRALIDVALERSIREGGGVTERAWGISAALVIVP